jgi:RHS repeat-associated protein
LFFDNLVINHQRGAVLEETHYYPFGLVMSGLSAKAVGKVENRKKFNGYEENKDLDVNWNESFYRVHDPQVGRFWQVDPKPTDWESLYAAMGNNPIRNMDILGDTIIQDGFKGNELLNLMNFDLKVRAKNSPLSFDKRGRLKINQKKVANLDQTQKDIVSKIYMINKLTKLITFKKVKGDFVTDPPRPGYIYEYGDGNKKIVANQLTIDNNGGALTLGADSKGDITILISETILNNPVGPTNNIDKSGNPLPNNSFLIPIHELSHVYFRDVLKESRKQQKGHSVDFENMIRRYHDLPERGYDMSHPNPDN